MNKLETDTVYGINNLLDSIRTSQSTNVRVGEFKLLGDQVVLNNKPTLLRRLTNRVLPPTRVQFIIQHHHFPKIGDPDHISGIRDDYLVACAPTPLAIECEVHKVVSKLITSFWATNLDIPERKARKLREKIDAFPTPQGYQAKFFPRKEDGKLYLVVEQPLTYKILQMSSHTVNEFLMNHKQIANSYRIVAIQKDGQTK